MSIESKGKNQEFLDYLNNTIVTGTCGKCGLKVDGPLKSWDRDGDIITRCLTPDCGTWIMGILPEAPEPAPVPATVESTEEEFRPHMNISIPDGYLKPGMALVLTMKPACLEREPGPVIGIVKPSDEDLARLRAAVAAVHGVPVKNVRTSVVKDERSPEHPSPVLKQEFLPTHPEDGKLMEEADYLIAKVIRSIQDHETPGWGEAANRWRAEAVKSREEDPDFTRTLPGDRERLELAWGIIANACGGDWGRMDWDWKNRAATWRDRYFATVQPGTAAARREPAPADVAGQVPPPPPQSPDAEGQPRREKPPLGLTPDWIWREHRLQEIKEAMDRNLGRMVPYDWFNEAAEHAEWIRSTGREFPEELAWAKQLLTAPAPPGYSLDREHLRTGAKLLMKPILDSLSDEERDALRKNTIAWVDRTQAMLDSPEPAPAPAPIYMTDSQIPADWAVTRDSNGKLIMAHDKDGNQLYPKLVLAPQEAKEQAPKAQGEVRIQWKPVTGKAIQYVETSRTPDKFGHKITTNADEVAKIHGLAYEETLGWNSNSPRGPEPIGKLVIEGIRHAHELKLGDWLVYRERGPNIEFPDWSAWSDERFRQRWDIVEPEPVPAQEDPGPVTSAEAEHGITAPEAQARRPMLVQGNAYFEGKNLDPAKFKGTWNSLANTPSVGACPPPGSDGEWYSVIGGYQDFKDGDLLVSNGFRWVRRAAQLETDEIVKGPEVTWAAVDTGNSLIAYRTVEDRLFVCCPNCGAVEIPTEAKPAPDTAGNQAVPMEVWPPRIQPISRDGIHIGTPVKAPDPETQPDSSASLAEAESKPADVPGPPKALTEEEEAYGCTGKPDCKCDLCIF